MINGQPNGPGWELLISKSDTTDLVMFGENHGVKEIASFANSFYSQLSSSNPRVLVTEIGPVTAIEVERMLREGTYESFMKKGTNLHSVPFFFLRQEVPLLRSALKFNPRETSPVIWGLDQEFIAGAPVILPHLDSLAHSEKEKSAVKSAKRNALLNPFLIGMGSGNSLKSLKESFKNSDFKEASKLTEQLVLSHKIYKEQMGGHVRWSNEARETLMMDNFLDYVADIPDSIPSMFFKFGSYHLHRSKSPTVKEALGLRLEKWARERQLSTFNIFVDAKSGKTLDALMGGTTDLPSTTIWEGSAFSKYLKDSPVLFDLRPLRKIAEVNDWHYKLKYMIIGYDYLLLFPEAAPQEFLEGTLVTHRYGLIVGILVFLILSLIIYLSIKWVKRRKKSLKGN